jgi:chaperonin GroES
MIFQPLNKKVLIKKLEEKKQETTASGIIIPGTNAQEKPLVGTIIAVAEDVDNISIGDKVMYAQYGGSDIVLNDEDHLVMDAESILGIIK